MTRGRLRGRDVQANVLRTQAAQLATVTREFVAEFKDAEAFDGETVRRFLTRWAELAERVVAYLTEREAERETEREGER
jgi:hypothetical protein